LGESTKRGKRKKGENVGDKVRKRKETVKIEVKRYNNVKGDKLKAKMVRKKY
jgi:hypothetical protein